MANLNYAESYQRELDQAFPNVLHFGALYATQNNNTYKWIDAKTIKVPHITTTGRVDATRDSIGTAARHYDNSWQTLTLTNERKWSTLVHPMDIDETNQTTTIANITRVMNEEQKFPEMDCYLVSKLYALAGTGHRTTLSTAPTASTVLATIDAISLAMDEANVPTSGRILYVTAPVYSVLKSASDIARQMNVNGNNEMINRQISRLEELAIEPVPSKLMKTLYNFTTGCVVDSSAKQIYMFMVHPSAVITPHKYEFATLDAPSAGSEGKWMYYEESHEDVFLLDYKKDAIHFAVEQ